MSGFGLVEMSRQRLHSSFLESSYHSCMHCGGKGVVRSVESCAMHALHVLEEAAYKNVKNKILISLPVNVSTYLLNVKRSHLVALETKYNVNIQIIPDETLLRPSDFKLERIREDGERQNINLHAQNKQDQKEKRKPDFSPKNNVEKELKKAEKIVAVKEKEPEEEPATESVEDNNSFEKKSKNKRRNEWRKRRREKRMMARLKRQAEREENASSAPVEMASGEEKFTVVEQKDFSEIKETEQKTEKPKSEKKEAKKQTNPSNSSEQNGEKKAPQKKKPQKKSRPSAKKEKENKPTTEETPVKKKEDKPILVEKESQDIQEPRQAKKGWWNKLVN